jgi:hypothetical protein
MEDADLDSNADGQFTNGDAAWSSVAVWRDLDQDGVTDSGELKSLGALQITRIGTVGGTTGGQAGTTVNGNRIALSATFTQAGATHDIDAVSLSSGAVELQNTPFYRDFTDTIALSDQAKALPDMQGSGRARDLREAMSLKAELADQVAAFSAATTRDAQLALIDTLITHWAPTRAVAAKL